MAQNRLRRKIGVPSGYKESWIYKEKIIKDNWKSAKIYQVKRRSRGTTVKKEGGFKIGTGIDWQWSGIGRVKKVGKNLYKHTINYTKKPKGVKLRGKKWLRFGKKR